MQYGENEKVKQITNKIILKLNLSQLKNKEVINGISSFVECYLYIDNCTVDEDTSEQNLIDILFRYKVRSMMLDEFCNKYNAEKNALLEKMRSSAEYIESSTLDKASIERGVLNSIIKRIDNSKNFSRSLLLYITSNYSTFNSAVDKKLDEIYESYLLVGKDIFSLMYNFFSYQYHTKSRSVAHIQDGTDYFSLAINYSQMGILKQGVIENYREALELLNKSDLVKISKEIGVKIKSGDKKDDIIQLIHNNPQLPKVIFNYIPKREIFSISNSKEFNKVKLQEIIQLRKYYEIIVEEIKVICNE